MNYLKKITLDHPWILFLSGVCLIYLIGRWQAYYYENTMISIGVKEFGALFDPDPYIVMSLLWIDYLGLFLSWLHYVNRNLSILFGSGFLILIHLVVMGILYFGLQPVVYDFTHPYFRLMVGTTPSFIIVLVAFSLVFKKSVKDLKAWTEQF